MTSWISRQLICKIGDSLIGITGGSWYGEPAMTNKLRILLADDHATVREGLGMILNSQPDMQVVGTASEGQAAITEAERIHPDVVIMDVSMPGLNGLEATTQLMKRSPSARVLTLTRHSDHSYLRQLMSAGAAGFVDLVLIALLPA